MENYQRPRNLRGDDREYVQTFKGGILSPVNAIAFRGSEGGLYDFRAVMQLAPIAGRMFTKVRARCTVVWVPLQGIYAHAYPDELHTGEAHIVREKLMSGDPLFPMEEENEITKRCFVHPMMLNGVPTLCSSTRHAHNAAVNHLRLRKHHKATLLDTTNMVSTPALLGQTVLDRFNAVLDPDDRVNGTVEFSIPNVTLPVKGVGISDWPHGQTADDHVLETGETTQHPMTGWKIGDTHGANSVIVESKQIDGNYRPNIRAEGELTTSQMRIDDFYKAERREEITRFMGKMIENDPVHGERKALAWAHGLRIDNSKTPAVLYDEEVPFGYSLRSAMDGANLDKEQTDSNVVIDLSIPVGSSEFGGVVVTFLSVVPDETLEYQPHPIMAQPWVGTKYTEEEMEYDPVRVTNRELSLEIPQSEETTTAFYAAHRRMQLRYSSYGLARNVDATTVENKSALWQIKIPLSVTGDTILYPDLEGQDNYPFSDWNGDLCQAFITAGARIPTPMIVGPSPVETIDIIEQNDLFGQDFDGVDGALGEVIGGVGL